MLVRASPLSPVFFACFPTEGLAYLTRLIGRDNHKSANSQVS